ncbi:hypothetical protein LCGC14_2855160 [marine sediment metagenome]|uniref:Uncharacterized protein n=1 Tax=marine sediment metagenome TaxID=412755 RepID=A0A0F8YU14_9ZZZZ
MRLVLADVVTYREACEFWDLDEVTDAHQILDIREELDEDQRKKAEAVR